jgi:hypothetical protein
MHFSTVQFTFADIWCLVLDIWNISRWPLAANRSVVVSEVLWFLNSQFFKLPKNEISSIMGAFYTYDEVNAAKSLLVDFAKSMHADYIPVFTERKGVNKVRATIDDLLSLFTLLDVHKVELPCYAILDVKRIPAIDSKTTWIHQLWLTWHLW